MVLWLSPQISTLHNEEKNGGLRWDLAVFWIYLTKSFTNCNETLETFSKIYETTFYQKIFHIYCTLKKYGSPQNLEKIIDM